MHGRYCITTKYKRTLMPTSCVAPSLPTLIYTGDQQQQQGGDSNRNNTNDDIDKAAKLLSPATGPGPVQRQLQTHHHPQLLLALGADPGALLQPFAFAWRSVQEHGWLSRSPRAVHISNGNGSSNGAEALRNGFHSSSLSNSNSSIAETYTKPSASAGGTP
ncbi:hypothetical protein B0H19DRAFT_1375922 [Mycena capillaripes]|nr:hypothetical protein B0H19DRAFT_1375922 [Mycena capillaripes]